jgi:hypothetical protein
MSWEKHIRPECKDPSPRMIIDFKDCIELKSWVEKKADEHKTQYSKIIKALIRDAIAREQSPSQKEET